MLSTHRQVIVAVLLLASVVANAQQQKQPAFSHPLTFSSQTHNRSERAFVLQSFPETVRVLAAMVEFAPDNDPYTNGNGLFDSSASTRIIDPAPHNTKYFQDHLIFIQNYFRKVSNGKLIIQGTVLDSIYHVKPQMSTYSPSQNSASNIELGNLMQDAWHTVDSLTPGFPFQQYQAFVIFHAGVGHDIDMISLFGYDPTPYDIPSIYLNLPSLQKMFGGSYQGVSVSSGTFNIPNSIIVPETENRLLSSGLGTSVLVQFGINGLLAASIGSYLGLPDLFDTKSGASGIGRFGLMDGQSIFSWYGIFPPEPSAWEKYFLGWINPITLSSGDTVYNLPAVGLTTTTDTVYRVLISEKEYFLVENRNRDANRDGDTVTTIFNNAAVKIYRARDTVGFNAYNQDSLYGVITDVDEFDLSLPGGVNTRTGEFFDGGILIWHIDENVIDANLATNTINADPNRKGVNLMEADGSQDIGQSYGFLEPGSGSEAGTQLDYWYSGNKATLRVLSNTFTPTSSPSSMSNAGANSHITLKNFSARNPRMTARIQVGDNDVKMLTGFPKTISGTVQNRSVKFVDTLSSMIVTTSQNIYGWKLTGDPMLPAFSASGVIAKTPIIGNGGIDFEGNVTVSDLNNDGTLDLSIAENGFSTLSPPFQYLEAFSIKDANADSLADLLYEKTLSQQITTSPAISDSFIALGAKHGMIYLFHHDGSLVDSLQSDTSDIVSLGLFQNPNQFLAVTSDGKVIVPTLVCPLGNSSVSSLNDIKPALAIAGILHSGEGKKIIAVSRNGYVAISPYGCLPLSLNASRSFVISTSGEILNSPALADIDGDGSRDIIVFSGNKIWAINAGGSVLDNFPITVSTSKTILTSPIVTDIDGNGTSDVVAVTQEGLVVAYDKTGKMARGFPLLGGINGGSTPAAFYMPSACLSCADIGLAVASGDGHLYGWKTGTLSVGLASAPKMQWPQYMHEAQNTGLDDSVLQITPRTSEFFPTSRAYNWPNPVNASHNYKTHIRYYVSNDSKVHIKIFDLAADLVTEFDAPGAGGLDNEIEWDVRGIQSGIYFAHIEAQSSIGSSNSGVAIVKIAVIK